MPVPAMTPADCEYYAGLLDAQLSVSVTRGKGEPGVRVQLVCDDERVFGEARNLAVPARETIVRRPGKRDSCVALLAGDAARDVLEFAAEHCVVKRALAAAAKEYLAEPTSERLAAVQALIPAGVPAPPDEVSVQWVSGFFDVRGTVDAPAEPEAVDDAPPAASDDAAVAADADEKAADADEKADDDGGDKKAKKPRAKSSRAKPRRAVVKLVLPKHEKSLIPAIQRVLGGKVKKSSPCRIVFEKASLSVFIESVGSLVRVKRADLACVA